MITNSFSQALEGTTKRLVLWFKLGKKATDVREEAAIQQAAANQNDVNINVEVDGGQHQQNYQNNSQNQYANNNNIKVQEENLD